MSTPEEAAAYCARTRVHCLAIPTPFAIGRVNSYLIEDSPLTLIDSGPNSGRSLDDLQRRLGAHGYSIDDIELALITHQHMDHLGLTAIVAEHSGADVGADAKLVWMLDNYTEAVEKDDAYSRDIMVRHGVPPDLVQGLALVSRAFRAWGAGVHVTKPLNDGDTIELRDRTLTVCARPGHSPSDMVFFDSEAGIAFTGDHLLPEISSNPLIHRPLEGDANSRPQALVRYIDSLRKTRELDATVTLPGHGPPVIDHRSLIDRRIEFHRKRAERIYDILAERPRNAYEVAGELWRNVAVTQAFLTLSEVLGHVDILINAGRVREREVDGTVTFAVE